MVILELFYFAEMDAAERPRMRHGGRPSRSSHRQSVVKSTRRRDTTDVSDVDLNTSSTKPHVDDNDTPQLRLPASVPPEDTELPPSSPAQHNTQEDAPSHSALSDIPPDDAMPVNPELLPLSHPCHPQHRHVIPSPKLKVCVRMFPHSIVLWRRRRWILPIMEGKCGA